MAKNDLLAAILRTLALVLGIAGAPLAFAFHFPWDQGHDTFDWDDPDPDGTCEGSNCDPCKKARGSPVYVSTGHLIWTETDVVLKGRPRLAISRTFNSNDPRDGLFGNGWSVGCDVGLYKATNGNQMEYIHRNADGKRYTHTQLADGSVQPPPGRFERVLPQANGTAILQFQDGRAQQFRADGLLAADIDRNSNRINYSYDASARLTSISDANGRALALNYNATGRVSSVVDHTGRTWAYVYDANGSLVSVTDPAGGVRRYQYADYTPTGSGFTYRRLIQITDESGVAVLAVTYSAGRVVTYTEGANTFTYTHTPTTRQASKRDSLGSLWRYTYNADGLITQVIDPVNATTGYVYDANGRNTRRTDPLGSNWDATYDAEGRILTTATPLGETISFAYAPNSRLPLPIRVTSPTGRVVETTFDARGNPTSIKDPSGQVSTMQWSSPGDLIAATNALGQTTRIEYNAIGLPLRETDPLGRISIYTYDSLGRLTATTNPAGETTSFTYDVLDRLITSTDALGRTVRYSYDAVGRVLSLTDPANQTTRYTYDTNGRLATRTSPDGRRHTYAYRADNLVSSVTQPNLTTISFSYDAAKRLTQESAGGLLTSISYNLRGEPTSLNHGGYTIARSYDAAGRLLTENQGGTPVSLLRNAEGERTSVTALGRTTTYERSLRGEITRIGGIGGDYRFEHDAAGRRIALTRPNGSRTDYSYDAAGQLTQIQHGQPFGARLVFTRDAVGRITRLAGDGDDRSYSYDAVGRLTRAQDGSTPFAYALDPAGNDTARGQIIDVTNNRLMEDSSHVYAYDLNGNMTEKRLKADQSRTTYAWNVKNQLVRTSRLDPTGGVLETTTYSYDAFGRRVTAVRGGSAVRHIYDGPNLFATLDSLGEPIVVNTFGPGVDEPIGQLSRRGERFLYSDHLGSVLATTTASAIAARYRYEPYGKRAAQGEQENPFGFTGRESDAADLQYYRSRYYDPSIGRFLSEDPIGLAGGLNLYAYAKNRPTGLVDPLGLNTLVLVGEGAKGGAYIGGISCGPACAAAGAVIGGVVVGVASFWLLDQLSNWILHNESDSGDAETETTKPGETAPEGEICPIPIPTDPTKPPREGMEWRGKQPVGGDKGAWTDPVTGESLHPDLGHGPPVGPHWDYNDGKGGQWRVDPATGIMTPK